MCISCTPCILFWINVLKVWWIESSKETRVFTVWLGLRCVYLRLVAWETKGFNWLRNFKYWSYYCFSPEKFVESTPSSMMDSPESLTQEGCLKEDMHLMLDGRESPDLPSSTSDSRDTIEVVNNDDVEVKSECGSSPGKPNNKNAGGDSHSSKSGSSEKAAPKNPLLLERCNCEELFHAVCHLETKELWDKFHDLGTEMIITKTGRFVFYF